MKKRIAALMGFCMIVSGICAYAEEASADDTAYTEKAVRVVHDGQEEGELTLRFYEETPNVPYLGIGAYSDYLYQQPLTRKEKEDGTAVLENRIGEELVFDPETGSITVSDWNRFFDLPLPLEAEAKGWKDTATRFIRITDVAFEGEAAPVSLDFGRYGIPVHTDENDIYLPVSTLSNIMTDIATNHMIFNGEKLYVQRISLDGTSPEGLYQTERLKAELQGQERPADIVKQSYADLCFNIDYFFGHPGKAPLDQAVAESGLEGALKSLGDEGEVLIRKLQSPKLPEYLSGVNKLLMDYLGDGHTLFSSVQSLILDNMDTSDNLSGMRRLGMEISSDLMKSPIYMAQLLHEGITLQRKIFWGSDNYRESGNTAIIRLDSFMPDEKAWDLYYSGEGEFPEDCLGTVLSGLRKASDNPDIENVIFDLSCNSGGSPDVMMAILAAATGQTQLYGIHKLTGRGMTFTFEADTNFDGIFDEKDKELKYDFNYGVLVTRHAFSCGNLFPFIIQEAGAVLIGEPSSGGSCCVQVGTDAEGFSYMMSSAQWQLTDSSGKDVEGGCSIDLPVNAPTNKLADAILKALGVQEGLPYYGKYFDDAYLSELMNAYFETEEEAVTAA